MKYSVQESFLTCVLQWSLVSLFLYILNRIYLRYFHEKYKLLEDGEVVFNIPEPTPQAFPRSAGAVPQTQPRLDDLPSYEEATAQKSEPNAVTLNPRIVSPILI